MKRLKLSKFHWAKLLSILFFVLLLGAYSNILAIGQKYNPGDTLDPACSPGEVNCTVLLSSGGGTPGGSDTQIQFNNNGVFGGNSGFTWVSDSSFSFSIGPNVVFTKADNEVLSTPPVDNISQHVHIARDVSRGIYNKVSESSYDNNTYLSPLGTEWNADGWSDFSNVASRTYVSFYEALSQNIGNNVLGTELVMHDIQDDKYYKIEFTSWSVGDTGGMGGFTYTRTLINPDFSLGTVVDFTRPDSVPPYDDISSSVHLTRGITKGLYNAVNETFYDDNNNLSPTGTEWNSEGWGDLTDVATRTYTTFYEALNQKIGNNIIGAELVMHDIVQDQYYKFSFSSWSSPDNGPGGGGFSYTRNLITLPGGVSGKLSASANMLLSGDDRYLNFGTDSGSLGYGIRDNAGIIEYKDDGNNWVSFSDGSPISVVNGSNLFSTGIAGTGSGVTGTVHSIFLGESAGNNATSASSSNFLGYYAGFGATHAFNSNFSGQLAGYFATGSYSSNFLGYYAGFGADSASNSNFLGYSTGVNADNANKSNFLGFYAGNAATNAANSIFIGEKAGYEDTVDNTINGSSSILIGSFTNTGGYSNSILLGSGTDGSQISNTKANQFMLADSITDVRWRGLEYNLPSWYQGGAGTVLANDGFGNLSWAASTSGLTSDANFNTKGGTNAGQYITSGVQNNTYLGYQAGRSAIVGGTNGANANNAVGSQSLYSNTTGYRNNAFGFQSLYFNTTGNNNVAIGSQSLYSNTTGSANSSLGNYSLYSNTTGGSNTAVGLSSLYSNTTGNTNTAIGGSSLNANTTGSSNTAIGYGSLLSNTTGYENTSSGYYSMYSNTTGYQNTANGVAALYSNTTGFQNTAIGELALNANTTGAMNTAVGGAALWYNTTGFANTAIGGASLSANTTGSYNTASGRSALGSNTTGTNNTANGSGSLSLNTTGTSNTAIGSDSLLSNTTGNRNVADGHQSLYFNTTGYSNTAVGYSSLYYNTTGYGNISIGDYSGTWEANGSTQNQTSNNSIYLGNGVRSLSNGDTNEIVIGTNAIGRGSNKAQWGNTSITNHYFSGNVQFSTYGAGSLITDASGNITASSDERLKDIQGNFDNSGEALNKILSINPILYKWNTISGYDQTTIYAGFSAQNVQEFIPEAVGVDPRGYLTLSDRPILATVINAIKEMDLKMKDLSSLDTTSATSLGSLMKGFLENEINWLEKIFVKTVVTENLQMKDSATGKNYCVTIVNGEFNKAEGECGSVTIPEEVVVPSCTDTQTLVDNVCVDKEVNIPTCTETQTLTDGVCVDNEPVQPTCTDTQTLTNGICVDDGPVIPTCTETQTLVDNICVDNQG